MASIDLNADLGEGDPYDVALLQIVSSCNVACGGHAGDAETMRATVRSAVENAVSIGAHPSYPDREGFGRRSRYPVMALPVLPMQLPHPGSAQDAHPYRE